MPKEKRSTIVVSSGLNPGFVGIFGRSTSLGLSRENQGASTLVHDPLSIFQSRTNLFASHTQSLQIKAEEYAVLDSP
jgi:hypothetical protein